MQKNKKEIAYRSIILIGFIFILLLWLPTFVASIKSITQETNISSSRVTKKIQAQSSEIFKDAGEKINKKIQTLGQEKQKKEALHTIITEILTGAASSSETSSTIPSTSY